MPNTLEDFEPLYAQPLENTIRLDGNAEDWGKAQKATMAFGSPSGTQDADFELLLGERADYLYAHIIKDDRLVCRDTEYLRLDNADHIGELHRCGRSGRSYVPRLRRIRYGDWFCHGQRMALCRDRGADNRVQGVLRQVAGANAIVLEFRIPLSLLGSRQYFGLTYVDVDMCCSVTWCAAPANSGRPKLQFGRTADARGA